MHVPAIYVPYALRVRILLLEGSQRLWGIDIKSWNQNNRQIKSNIKKSMNKMKHHNLCQSVEATTIFIFVPFLFPVLAPTTSRAYCPYTGRIWERYMSLLFFFQVGSVLRFCWWGGSPFLKLRSTDEWISQDSDWSVRSVFPAFDLDQCIITDVSL